MNLTQLDTAAQVLDALGGNKGVEALTASSQTRVANWRAAGCFPSNTYVAMIDALAAVGKSAPAHLWRMREPAEGFAEAYP